MFSNDVRIAVRYVLFVGILLTLSASAIPSAFAQTSEFSVSTLIGGDSAPPTVPTGLVATPVTTTQINLTWNPSTDDFLLSGYKVWRNDTFIATTTATNYSDVGLTASTTYTYYVTAFDSYSNHSASSSPSSTTTLSIPTTPTSTPVTDDGSQGSLVRPFGEQIRMLEVLSGRDSVVIRYETYGHIRSVIRWGRTSSYELGSLVERAFSKDHETRITGLTPGVTYYFTIEGENQVGRHGTMYTGTFMTLPPEDTFPPGNVRGLTATLDGDDIVLSWINPSDTDFAKVRIMRNDRFYPTDIADGWLVYEGSDTIVRDTDVLQNEGTQYYTVFTYDELGNISSGAVISVTKGKEGEEFPPEPDPLINPLSLDFNDVLFAQDGIVLKNENGVISIDGAKQLAISIPYERLPEHLKTVLVSIGSGDGSGKTFKFLLRVDREKHFYTGTLAPFGLSGTFPVVVSVFDYTTAQVGYAEGTIIATIKTQYIPSPGFLEYLADLGPGYWYMLLFLLLFLLLIILGYRSLSRSAS